MTKNKGIRLINELIEKYGDVDVVLVCDYYAAQLLDENTNMYIHNNDVIIDTIKLSQMIGQITNRDEYNNIVKIIEGKENKPKKYVVIQESKDKYDTDEQRKLRENSREKHLQKYEAFMRAINTKPIPLRRKLAW